MRGALLAFLAGAVLIALLFHILAALVYALRSRQRA